MSKKLWRGYYRHPKTTQERRANGKRSKWARAKRSEPNLPQAYDDISVSDKGKSWKNKRKTQYICGGRGTKCELYIPSEDGYRYTTWRKLIHPIEKYCEYHNISHSIKDEIDIQIVEHVQTHAQVCIDTVPVFREGSDGILRVWYYRNVWEQVPLETPIVTKRRYATVKGYNLTFWTPKYTGLFYFLRQLGLTPPKLGV